MVEPPENTFISPFVYPQNSLIRAFRTLFIFLIPSKPLRLSLCTALILDLSSFHIIVSLPYIGTGTRNFSCKTLVHSSYKPLALDRGLIEPATLLPLTTFLPHCLICTCCVQQTSQIFKFQHMLQSHPIYTKLTLQSLLPTKHYHLDLTYIHRGGGSLGSIV